MFYFSMIFRVHLMHTAVLVDFLRCFIRCFMGSVFSLLSWSARACARFAQLVSGQMIQVTRSAMRHSSLGIAGHWSIKVRSRKHHVHVLGFTGIRPSNP